MPFYTKYQIKFKSITGRNLTVYFNFSNWHAADITSLTGGPEPFSLSNQNSDENILVGIRGTQATITYRNDGTVPVTAFLADDDQSIQVALQDDDTTQVLWWGFIVQDDCREPFMPAPKIVTLTATDNLALLKDLEFTDLNGDKVFDKLLLTEYFNILLNKTGLNLAANTFCNVFENGMDDRSVDGANDPFAQTKVHTRTFTKDSDTFEDCYTVLTRILESWECQLFQHLGQWFIVRWPELSDFDNLIPGTLYASDFTTPTATVLPATVAIGKTQNAKFVNANQEKSILRYIKYDKLTFNYEQPQKLILNDDLKRLGSFIGTSIVGSTRYDDYQLSDFVNVGGAGAFIRIETDNVLQIEKQRYIYQPDVGNTSGIYFESSGIEVNATDRIDASYTYKATADSSVLDNAQMIVRVVSGATTYYLNRPSSALGGHLVWNTVDAAQYPTISRDAAADLSQWNTFSLTGAGDGETVVIPADGIIYFAYFLPNISGDDYLVKEFTVDYYTYINESTRVTGQFHKSEQPLKVIKKNTEKTLYLDDSPKNNIRGTMFLVDGTTKTSIWHAPPYSLTFDFDLLLDTGISYLNVNGQPDLYSNFQNGQQITISGTASNDGTYTISNLSLVVGGNFSMNLTPGVTTETVTGGTIQFHSEHQFGFIQKVGLMKMFYTNRVRIEGDAKGIYSSDYIGLTTVFSLDDLANKFFIMSTVKMNFKSEIWSGVIQEMWDNTETIRDADFINTFEYIYKTQ